MSIDKETVAKIAKLARIKVEDNELEKLSVELSETMSWIEQLSEVDTDGVEPLTSVVDMDLYKRADEVTDGGIRDKIVANSPESAEGFFVVNKIVE